MKQVFVVKWVVKESETARIQMLLPELVAKSGAETGNVFYQVYQAEADRNMFILHECYADPAAVEAHRQSEHYQRFVVKEIIPHLVVREVIAVKQLH